MELGFGPEKRTTTSDVPRFPCIAVDAGQWLQKSKKHESEIIAELRRQIVEAFYYVPPLRRWHLPLNPSRGSAERKCGFGVSFITLLITFRIFLMISGFGGGKGRRRLSSGGGGGGSFFY